MISWAVLILSVHAHSTLDWYIVIQISDSVIPSVTECPLFATHLFATYRGNPLLCSTHSSPQTTYIGLWILSFWLPSALRNWITTTYLVLLGGFITTWYAIFKLCWFCLHLLLTQLNILFYTSVCHCIYQVRHVAAPCILPQQCHEQV